MAVVKINAIEVSPDRASELEERFAKRAGEVEKMPGFLGFELLRPVEGETRYFVYTRWESEEAFRAWVESSSFTRGPRAGGAPTAARSRSRTARAAELRGGPGGRSAGAPRRRC